MKPVQIEDLQQIKCPLFQQQEIDAAFQLLTPNQAAIYLTSVTRYLLSQSGAGNSSVSGVIQTYLITAGLEFRAAFVLSHLPAYLK